MTELSRPQRDKAQLKPLDSDPVAVLASAVETLREEVQSLRDSLASPDAAATARAVEHHSKVIGIMHALTDEYGARLEWFVKLGTRVRDLMDDLTPDAGEAAMPSIASAVAAAHAQAAPSGKSIAAPSAPYAPTVLPPELAELLGKLMK